MRSVIIPLWFLLFLLLNATSYWADSDTKMTTVMQEYFSKFETSFKDSNGKVSIPLKRCCKIVLGNS